MVALPSPMALLYAGLDSIFPKSFQLGEHKCLCTSCWWVKFIVVRVSFSSYIPSIKLFAWTRVRTMKCNILWRWGRKLAFVFSIRYICSVQTVYQLELSGITEHLPGTSIICISVARDTGPNDARWTMASRSDMAAIEKKPNFAQYTQWVTVITLR